LADTLVMTSDAGTTKVLDEIRRRQRAGAAGPGPGRMRLGWWGLTLLVVAAAVIWTIRSSRALSHTFDEPHHLATGLEWWQAKSYRWWTENPPLPKIAVAMGPHFAGLRLPDRSVWEKTHPWAVGIDLLYKDGNYEKWLRLARLGTLPFLLLALGMTFLLAGGVRRPFAGFVATALVATYPPLLGHAALATTDVAAVATTLLFLYCLDRWWDRRTLLLAAAVGAAFGLAMLCKLTAPLLCGAAAAGWLVGRRITRKPATDGPAKPAAPRPSSPERASVPRQVRRPVHWPNRARAGGAAGAGHPVLMGVLMGFAGAVAAFVVVWAGYRFSIGRIDDLPALGYMKTPILPPLAERPGWLAALARLPLPAPEVPHGYLFLRTHNSYGHLAYLFGKVNDHGFWSFYLVGLLFKSPLTFLLAALGAVLALVRLAGKSPVPAAGPAAGLAAVAALLLSIAGTVNIGLRHLLAVVPLGAVWIATAADALGDAAAAVGKTVGTMARPFAVGGAALLIAGQAAVVETAEPELMAYFNPLAGREPGEILIDSDLDWGQDFLLLKREMAARKIGNLRIAFFGTVRPCGADMPMLRPLVPRQPATGWVVISENYYRAPDLIGLRRDPCDPGSGYGFHEAPADGFAWLRAHTPVARIGASLRLYDIRGPEEAPAAGEQARPAADGGAGGAASASSGAGGTTGTKTAAADASKADKNDKNDKKEAKKRKRRSRKSDRDDER
jgi:hypothetical protein